MKSTRRPLLTTLTLLVVVSMIYFMTSSSDKGLGEATPINVQKYAAKDEPLAGSFKQQQQKEAASVPEPAAEAPKIVKPPTTQDDLADFPVISGGEFTETPFMPKMANETLKAQLGNAAWRLFHTILARYPDTPSTQEQATLSQYIQLFAQVYPCGDCARHFQQLLAKYPPQTKSRKTAALWGCHVHNKVNERLGKDEYDCTTILEDYDCGCGSDEKEADATLGSESLDHLRKIKVGEKEDRQLGG